MQRVFLICALVIATVIASSSFAATLGFENNDGVTSTWTEAGVTWTFVGGDSRTYTPRSGSRHWWPFYWMNPQLVADRLLDIPGLFLYLEMAEETESLSISGYDAADNPVGMVDLDPLDYELGYVWVALGWSGVKRIQIDWNGMVLAGMYIDDVEFTAGPGLTFTNGAAAELSYAQSSPSPLPHDNLPIGQLSFTASDTGATLDSVAVTLTGTYSGLSGMTPFRLYASNSNDFGAASAIGSDAAASGGTVTFGSLSDALPTGPRYYWVTADVGVGGDGTITGTIANADAISLLGAFPGPASEYGALHTGGQVTLPVELSSFAVE